MSELQEHFETEQISVIQNPFSVSCIEGVSMFMNKKFFGDGFTFRGNVKFINNNTQGKQSFEADSMHGLYMKISEFIKTLEQ